MNTPLIPRWEVTAPQEIATQTRLLLSTRGLLTLKLTAQCGAPMQVQTLFEDFGQILPDEANTLALAKNTSGWVRVVLLNCQGKNMLYARSFIPLYQHEQKNEFLQGKHAFSDIRTLGEHPLGLWLAKQKTIKRTPFQFSLCPANYWSHWPAQIPTETLVARQSLFEYQQQHLLLTEVFL